MAPRVRRALHPPFSGNGALRNPLRCGRCSQWPPALCVWASSARLCAEGARKPIEALRAKRKAPATGTGASVDGLSSGFATADRPEGSSERPERPGGKGRFPWKTCPPAKYGRRTIVGGAGMMTQGLKVGDIVQLKSGGPKMAVVGTSGDDRDGFFAMCIWFADSTGRKEQGSFRASVLRLPDDELASSPPAAPRRGEARSARVIGSSGGCARW
jgi:uncharacterized protein YodC (DUF2158 family)